MKIVIAPDSFKGSLTNTEAAHAIKCGVLAAIPGAEIDIIPIADGGEGTMQTLVASTKGQLREAKVIDPLGRSIVAEYGILGDGVTAVVEMAKASGLLLLKNDERNPLQTTTYGTGQLISHALNLGYRKIIVAVGGSASNDCGAGMAQALDIKFFRENSIEITEKITGGLLYDISDLDTSHLHPHISQSEIIIASDVMHKGRTTNVF